MAARRISLEGWLNRCAGVLDVGGVDIIAEQMPKRTKRYWLEVKKRCTDLRLTIASLSPGNDFGKPTERQRRAQVDSIKRWVEAAWVMGSPCLRIFAGWPPKEQAQALWPKMIQCIRSCAKAAAQAGVTLAVEPHNHGGFVSSSRQALRLIREVASPWVGINLDTGNYLEKDFYAGLEATLPYAPHVVAKVHDLDARGEAIGFNYGRIFTMLKRHQYHGFVTLEYEGRADEVSAVPRAIKLLKRKAQDCQL